MTDIAVRIDDRQARRLLREAARKSADLRPAFGDLNANVVQPIMVKRFDTAGAYLGSRWRPLAMATLRGKLRMAGGKRSRRLTTRRGRAKGGVFRPLWDSGRLRRAWTRNSGESVVAIERLRYERGVVVPYAAPHQHGGQGGRPPQREQVTEDMARYVGQQAAERIAKYVTEG